jgi:amino acid transporter
LAKPEEVFIRRASGLVRVVSPSDLLVYAFMNPTIPYAYHYIIWSQALYPGASPYIASLFILTLFPIAALYWLLSTAMPRSGGEYIYTSRILHPMLGLLGSWGMVLGGGLMWSGCLAVWGNWWGWGSLFIMEGLRTNNPTLVNIGKYLATVNQPIPYLIGLATIALAAFFWWRGTKWVMRASWFITIATWVMLGAYIYINLTATPEAIAERMARLQGVDYNYVLEQAKSVGWSPGIMSIAATMMAGMTYYNLSTLGSTYAANIAGEVKEVQKAQLLAQLGSLTLFIIYWELFSYATYSGLGRNLIEAISYINAAGLDEKVWGLPFTPVCYYLTLFLTDNPILMHIAGPIGFLIINFGGIMGLGFAPTRNLFAYAFDGLLPKWVCSVDKKGRAWGAALLGFIIAAIIHTINSFTPWLAYIAHTIALWFLSWVLLGIAGMLFHIRQKSVYEASPSVVKKKIGRIPVTAILGFVTAVISAMVVYFVLYAALTGAAVALQLKYLGSTIAVVWAIPIIICSIYMWREKRKGVPIELRFKEIPPD